MPLQIIDTGYGLERFCWAAAGTPTIYEAIYPESVAWLKDLAGFSAGRFDMNQDELDSLLGEMSRLFGIMNIEVGRFSNNEIVKSLGQGGPEGFPGASKVLLQ